MSDNQYPYLLQQYLLAMKDQNSIHDDEASDVKYQRAVDLFIESVHKPDNALRACAHNQKCYNELMNVRERIIEYALTLRNDV